MSIQIGNKKRWRDGWTDGWMDRERARWMDRTKKEKE